MVFNGDNKYNLIAKKRGGNFYKADYIAAVYYQATNVYQEISLIPTQSKGLEFDADNGGVGNIYGIYGYGKYKIKLSNAFLDSIILDIDANASGDLLFNIYNDSIVYNFSGGSYPYIKLTPTSNHIMTWKPFGPTQNSQKSMGNFKYDYGTTVDTNNYTKFPQDSRSDCNVLVNTINQNNAGNILTDSRSGVLTLNLTIDKNITTRDTLIDEPTNIVITKNAALKINSNKTFDMITPISSFNNLIVEDTAYLILYNGAKIIVDSTNKLTLKNKSNLTLLSNSEIRIKNGAGFCNEGGKVRGPGMIIIEKGIHEFCSYVNDFVIEDSTKIILEDSAVVIFPDDYTLHLRGNTTSLVMKPGSKMMFGENSGIICDSGAKLIANNAVFTSFDSTKKWNGISLKHRSQDTIKNCVIKNADFGINIMNKNDNEGTEVPYSTEISGCSFINQTSHVLNNAIYAAGSSIILISNNV